MPAPGIMATAMIQRVYRRVTAGLALAFVVIVLVGVLPVAPALSRLLLVAEPPRRADAIVVLGGGVHDADMASVTTTARLVHGLRLHHHGYAPVVILTGGNPIDPSVPEAAVMARVAEEVGTQPDVLIVERVADRTATQGEAVARIARERGIRTILLVTSPEHSYRSVRVFKKTGLDVVSTPVVAARLPRLSLALRPRYVVERLCWMGTLGYESAAIALYWWRGWL
jgi:uncharacterized SAM-binding protein YcdF (DUF218 family)